MTGIYKITSPTGRVYIGQAVDIKKRWIDYKNLNNCKPQTRLYRSLIKHKSESHIFEIIEECLFEQLNIRERYWQEFYDVIGEKGLNCQLTNTNSLPRIFSRETRLKISEARKGKFSGENHPNFGKKAKLSTRQKISEGNKGKTVSMTSRKQMSESHKGLKCNKCHNSTIVLDLQTGVFFDCIKEAAEAYNINYATLKNNLGGRSKNKTNLIKC